MSEKPILVENAKIHIYAGDGKGKTTAAVGLAVRAAGSGLNVLFLQFLKNGRSSELRVLEKIPGITVSQSEPIKKFIFFMDEQEKAETRKITTRYFAKAVRYCREHRTDLLILDELLDAVNSEMIELSQVVEFLQNRNKHLEVVMTGRNPAPELVELADYYTEMRAVKHPYKTEGLLARPGIEY